jgi:predicted MPP superfamily phosphohydrolase
MDWDFISRWTADNARRTEGQRFLREYDGANKFLDSIQSAVRAKNKKAQIIIIQGNHDYRVEVVMDKTPMYEGMLEMEKNLRFRERNITYWKFWEHRKPYRIGNAFFIHGEFTNDNHAKKTAMTFDHPVFYGHTHDIQRYTRVMRGGDKTIAGQSLGCLCRYDLTYMGHKPSNWSQAFATFYFREDGYFNYYVTEIFKHRFTAPDGKTYKG